MTEPIKYIRIVGDILQSYQKELIKYLRKSTIESMTQFKRNFGHLYDQLRQTELHKSITEDKVSDICKQMKNFFDLSNRKIRTSQQNRRIALQSQDGKRSFRFTGGIKKMEEEPIDQLQSIQEDQGFSMGSQFMPKMRMKWKSPDKELNQSYEPSTIGNNNINLLSYTIPQMENSIRRLSLQRSPKSSREKEKDFYRTIDSRTHKKRYIPRLF